MELMGVGEEKTKMTQQSNQRKQKKKEVCGSILRQLAETGNEAAKQPGFAQDLQAHFIRLPTRLVMSQFLMKPFFVWLLGCFGITGLIFSLFNWIEEIKSSPGQGNHT